MDNIILLSDHTWFYVINQRDAQNFVDHHNWEDVPIGMRYGVYISITKRDIIYSTKGEE